MVENRTEFLQFLADLELYFIEFDIEKRIKEKNYQTRCEIVEKNWQPVIFITRDECTFSANDRKRYIWKMVRDTLLRPKKKGSGIMVSEFLLFFARLGLSHSSQIQQEEIMRNPSLKINAAVESLEYRENNDGYLDGVKLLWQVIEKVLPIAKVLYFRYSILFMFDNATSHSIYA